MGDDQAVTVAAKCFDVGQASSTRDAAIKMLRREVRVLSEVRDPNVVGLYGLSTERLCLFLEYAPLGSLRSVLDVRRRPNCAPAAFAACGLLLPSLLAGRTQRA